MKKITILSLVITLSTFSNQAISQVTNNLILHFSFDNGNALDEIGTNNGTIYGATLCPDRFGNPNMAYQFNSSYIGVATCNLGNLTEASMSIWLEPDNLTFTGGIAAPVHLGPWAIYMNRYNPDARLHGMFDSSSLNNSSSDQSQPISTSGWTHIVATNNGSSTSLYINGVLEASYNGTFVWIDGTYLELARQPNGGPLHYYNGKLDDFRIYGKALNQLEIDTLYNMANPTTAINDLTASNNIDIYPNPTSNQLTVTDNQLSINKIEIIDVAGKAIKLITQYTNTINVSELQNGIYFVKFYTDENTIIRKFSKQ